MKILSFNDSVVVFQAFPYIYICRPIPTPLRGNKVTLLVWQCSAPCSLHTYTPFSGALETPAAYCCFSLSHKGPVRWKHPLEHCGK